MSSAIYFYNILLQLTEQFNSIRSDRNPTNVDILSIIEVKPVKQIKPLTIRQTEYVICQTTLTEVTSNKCSWTIFT